VKKEMKQILTESKTNLRRRVDLGERDRRPRYRELRDAGKKHPIEDIGKKLRAMMPSSRLASKRFQRSPGDTD